MRTNKSSSRTKRSGRRVQYANERRKTARRTGRSRRPQRSPPVRLTKDGLFNFYFLVILGPVLLVVAGFVAFFAHDVALPAMFAFVTNSAAAGISEMGSRPTLIIAFIFVLSVLWCISGGDPPSSSPGFRRGRDVGGLDRAQKRSTDHSLRSSRSQSQTRR